MSVKYWLGLTMNLYFTCCSANTKLIATLINPSRYLADN